LLPFAGMFCGLEDAMAGWSGRGSACNQVRM